MSRKAWFSAALAATLFWTLFVMVTSAFAVNREATWQDNSNNENGFVFQSCPGICPVTGAWKEIGKVGPNVTKFMIVGVLPGSTTSYRVGADSAAGTAWSPIVVDVVPPLPDAAGPVVAITSHTNNQVVTTNPIMVSGTASDSSGISSVTVNGVAAGGSTAWSSFFITLNPGANTITVVAKDASAAQNQTTMSITVNYTPSTVPTAPTTVSFPTCNTLKLIAPGVYQCVP